MKSTILFLSLFLASLLPAQDNWRDRRDGHWWKNVGVEHKAPYVCGMLDGIFVGGVITKNQDAQKKAADLLANRTVTLWIQQLDDFYSKPENLGVSTIDALASVVQRQ